MSVGMVYMRPLRLAGVTVAGASEEQIRKSWSVLNEWILRKGFSHEVEVGYGLFVSTDAGSEYIAGIELPPTATPAEANELKRASLQGGAYFRRRFQGLLSAIPNEFDAMQQELSRQDNICYDSERPLVTVFLDMKQMAQGSEIRSNLLIPVRGAQMTGRPSAAA